MDLNFNGLLLAVCTFLIIGICHPSSSKRNIISAHVLGSSSSSSDWVASLLPCLSGLCFGQQFVG